MNPVLAPATGPSDWDLPGSRTERVTTTRRFQKLQDQQRGNRTLSTQKSPQKAPKLESSSIRLRPGPGDSSRRTLPIAPEGKGVSNCCWNADALYTRGNGFINLTKTKRVKKGVPSPGAPTKREAASGFLHRQQAASNRVENTNKKGIIPTKKKKTPVWSGETTNPVPVIAS